MALDELHPGFEVGQHVVVKNHPGKINVELVAVILEHFLDPKMKIVHDDASADSGVAPNERRRLLAVSVPRPAVFDELDEFVEIIRRFDFVVVP